jgi:hypothetical protein
MTLNLTPRKCLAYRSPVDAVLGESLAGTSKSGLLEPLRFTVESTRTYTTCGTSLHPE